MAFSSSITRRPKAMGDMRMSHGTFTQGNGDTGGDIITGMRDCKVCITDVHCTASISGGTVTITTADPGAAQEGQWIAYGY